MEQILEQNKRKKVKKMRKAEYRVYENVMVILKREKRVISPME